MTRLSLFVYIIFLIACQDTTKSMDEPGANSISQYESKDIWNDYWYSGEAEINVYNVIQSRYNHLHPGKTVLIFVTEDFLIDKQVKNESNQKQGSTSVLKTNLIRKFNTGMYDYSIMSSVFTPVDRIQFPHSLKVTTSSQDWCGQSFMQYNLKNHQFLVQQYSYFESEGDESYKVSAVINEDELFNLIRFNPALLPEGSFEMLPGSAFCRLKHQRFQKTKVIGKRTSYTGGEFAGDDLERYSVEFSTFQRTLEIIYKKSFPYQIEGWVDTYPNSLGEQISSLSKKTSIIRSPYWSKHNPEDSLLRSQLGL